MKSILARAAFAAGLVNLAVGALTSIKAGAPSVTTHLWVDGVACGTVNRWEGGDLRATPSLSGTGIAPDNFVYAPASFEVPFPCAKPLMDLIADLCIDGKKYVTLVFSDVVAGGTTSEAALEIKAAVLRAVHFPALSRTGGAPMQVKLVFVGQGPPPRAVAAPPAVPVEAPKAASSSNFRFRVQGIDFDGVASIGAFSVTREADARFSHVGSGAGASPISTRELPVLLVKIPRQSSTAVSAWCDRVMAAGMQGRSVAAEERVGSLELANTGGQTLLTFQFTNIGITRLSVLPNAGPGPRFLEAELYMEGLKIVQPAPPPEAVKSVKA